MISSNDQDRCTHHLGLPVMGVVHWVGVEPLIVLRGEQDAPLVAYELTEEVLLFIIMDWGHITCQDKSVK